VGSLRGKENALRGRYIGKIRYLGSFPAAGVVGTCGGGIKKSFWRAGFAGYRFFYFLLLPKTALKIFNPSFLLLKKLKIKRAATC
jgi:hypothetical protein